MNILNSNGGGGGWGGWGNFKQILKPTISRIHICFHSFIDQCIKNLFYFKLFILKILKLNFLDQIVIYLFLPLLEW